HLLHELLLGVVERGAAQIGEDADGHLLVGGPVGHEDAQRQLDLLLVEDLPEELGVLLDLRLELRARGAVELARQEEVDQVLVGHDDFSVASLSFTQSRSWRRSRQSVVRTHAEDWSTLSAISCVEKESR